VLRLVMGQAVMLALAGVAIGTAVGLLVAPALGTQLFGVGGADPLTYAGVAIVLVVIAAGAALVPSRRAMRIDPAITLRQ
jgi:ABC-type antimicrobial peptide transport system permease subunit